MTQKEKLAARLVIDDFSGCYLTDPRPEEIKAQHVIHEMGLAPWKVARLAMRDGRILYRLYDGRPLQVGIFEYKGDIKNYAPVSAQTLIPIGVLTIAKRVVSIAHAKELGNQ